KAALAEVRPLLGSLDRILEETAMRYASDDTQAAYLFQCGNEELFAVCLDRSGQGSRGARARRGGFYAKSFSSACRNRSRQPSLPSPSCEASSCGGTTFGAAATRVSLRARPSNR